MTFQGGKSIGGSKHFTVVMPETPKSFWAAAKAAGIKHSHKSFHDAIEEVSYHEAVKRGNYWCQVNGIALDPAAVAHFNFSKAEFAGDVLPTAERKFPEGWNVIALHAALNWQFAEYGRDAAGGVFSKNYNAQGVAAEVRKRGYKGGPIILLTCRAGRLTPPEGYTARPPCPAQELANLFGMPVVGASGFIFTSLDGRFNSREGRMGTFRGQAALMPAEMARWRCFVPGT
jgi:hypothetical protein